ncbi:hypothetical protein Rhe02_07400 [Rhizocola hellebori]|uniref:Uncharacterized protein n=1 Tax=Rhizocola hellebori TaxID=1392758 RepID=A0A8J3Q2H8_9ACTN|nr:hypothetical protein [Rhizocola hellebori]GIH02673.1 hypothetical protein Rhe02_07400 [Rhizocola hellebori]
MRFRRFFATALATMVAGALAVIAVPQPAAADGPVYVALLWVRCQDDTGEWGADEILLEIGGNPGTPAGILNSMHVGDTKYVYPAPPGYQPSQEIVGDATWIWVWERDDPNNRGSWDLQGVIEVRRDLVNTGEHEGYAFWDGQFIVRYTVVGG